MAEVALVSIPRLGIEITQGVVTEYIYKAVNGLGYENLTVDQVI